MLKAGTTSKRFTLLEVLVAIAILGMSLVMILQILNISRQRLMRAERRWGRRHLIEQAAEFHLLAGPAGHPPEYLLPEGYRSDAELIVDQRNLPESCRAPVNGWLLATLRVQVFGPDDIQIAEQKIEKIVPDNDGP